MNTVLRLSGYSLPLLLALSCAPQVPAFTDAERAAVADSARALLAQQDIGAESLSGAAWTARFSSDPDARFAGDGVVYALDALRTAADVFYSNLESLKVAADATDVIVLGPEAAVIVRQAHMIVKTKTGQEATVQLVFTGVVQRRDGQWQMVQTHESELNAADFIAAITPDQPAG